MTSDERAVLSDQLDELLAMGVDDEDDALEVAALAGLLDRLGASKDALADAVSWRVGPGADLLDDVWDELDLDDLVEAVDACTAGGVEEEAVDEAVFDLDEVVAAAVWCGQTHLLLDAVKEVASAIRLIPEPFAHLAPYARELTAAPGIEGAPELYGYWFAIADAGQWIEDEAP